MDGMRCVNKSSLRLWKERVFIALTFELTLEEFDYGIRYFLGVPFIRVPQLFVDTTSNYVLLSKFRICMHPTP